MVWLAKRIVKTPIQGRCLWAAAIGILIIDWVGVATQVPQFLVGGRLGGECLGGECLVGECLVGEPQAAGGVQQVAAGGIPLALGGPRPVGVEQEAGRQESDDGKSAPGSVEIPADVAEFMETLRMAIASGSSRRIGQNFSLVGVVESLGQRALLPEVEGVDAAEWVKRLEVGLRPRFSAFRSMAWESTRWLNFERSAEDRVEILGRHYDVEGMSQPIRWYLQREGDRWRIYDFEMLGMGVRFSALLAWGMNMGAASNLRAGVLQEFAQSAELLQQGLLDEDGLEALVENADELMAAEVPQELRRFVLLIRAVAFMALEELAVALQDLGALEQLPVESPVLHQLRGEIYVVQERYELAIESFRKYGERLGFDAALHESISDAYQAMDKWELAAEHARLGLADQPLSIGCLASLAAALPAGRVEQLLPYFERHGYSEEALASVILWCVQTDRLAGARYTYKLLKEKQPSSELIAELRETLDFADF